MKKTVRRIPNFFNFIICVGILFFSQWSLNNAAQQTKNVPVYTGQKELNLQLGDIRQSDILLQNVSEEESEDIPEETEETEETYVEGEVLDEHVSMYIPEATVRTVVRGQEPVTCTIFKCGRVLSYDVDAFIDEVDETEFFYMLVEAENGNQSSLARRLTADCLLNQVASPKYPDTIKEAILNHNMYEVVSKGSIFTVTPQESTKQCVDTEMISQIDYSVMYFRTKHFHKFGVPYEHVGDCWFSKPGPDDSTQWLNTED